MSLPETVREQHCTLQVAGLEMGLKYIQYLHPTMLLREDKFKGSGYYFLKSFVTLLQ